MLISEAVMEAAESLEMRLERVDGTVLKGVPSPPALFRVVD